jgi:hypothetical protein
VTFACGVRVPGCSNSVCLEARTKSTRACIADCATSELRSIRAGTFDGASHLRSAASTVRGMRAFGELSTASAGSAAAICPASSAAQACSAASAPADAWCIVGQRSCSSCHCCFCLVACAVVLQALRLLEWGQKGAKVDRLAWQVLLLSCCPGGNSSELVMAADEHCVVGR